jgi:ubiquinone/menaquinone biosynthesis C-methylase UbiE
MVEPSDRGEARAPSPRLILDSINAYQRSAALKAAVTLDLFSAIAAGAATPAALAPVSGADARALRILCDYLAVVGFLVKAGGRYGLTPDSAHFLDRRSPAYIGAVVDFLGLPAHMACFADLADTVRHGGPRPGGSDQMSPSHPVWVDFARAMGAMREQHAEALAALLHEADRPALKILDVACGHAKYGIALARRHPKAAVTALDWPNVLAVAAENAAASGLASRFRLLPGDAGAVEFGAGYDVVLLTHFLNMLGAAEVGRLLARTHAALAPGGRAVIVDYMPDEDRLSPAYAAMFALMMLGTTPSGDSRTVPEYEALLREAGFSSWEATRLPPAEERILIARR